MIATPLPPAIAAMRAAARGGLADPLAALLACRNDILAAGPAPVWISVTSEEDLRARATALCAARDGGATLPLFGVPFAVKDNIDALPHPTTAACPGFAYTPQSSAEIIARLEAAGAVVMGKTNLDQFATGLVGTRSPYGIVANAFDPAVISGGSSSGSAIAVARGEVAFALGTDTAGSGRVPAALNNLVGLKPSRGLLSTRGVVPACRSLDCVSIFALTPADAAMVLAHAAGFDAQDDYARALPGAERSGLASLQGVRVGVPDAPLDLAGNTAFAEMYAAAVRRVRAAGAVAVKVDVAPLLEAARLLYEGPWVAERDAAFGDFARAHPQDMNSVVHGIVCGAPPADAVSAFRAQYRLAALARAAAPIWRAADTLMLPTIPTIPRIAQVLEAPVSLNAMLGRFTNFTNLLDLCAIAVPAGFLQEGEDAGLPFGVTLFAQAGGDGRLLGYAEALHRTLGNARLGATALGLQDAPRLPAPAAGGEEILLAVVGAHLTGQPLNHQLTSRRARLIGPARCAAGYALHALPGQPAKPGLLRKTGAQGGIALELWALSPAAFGSFVAEIPAPLGIGTITLDDGRQVKGFLCEAEACATAPDITHFGGWRAYLAAQSGTHTIAQGPAQGGIVASPSVGAAA